MGIKTPEATDEWGFSVSGSHIPEMQLFGIWPDGSGCDGFRIGFDCQERADNLSGTRRAHQEEIDFDSHLDVDWFVVKAGGFKTPLANGVFGCLYEAVIA